MPDLTVDDVAQGYLAWCRNQKEECIWAFEILNQLAFEQRWDELWDLTIRAIELTPRGDRPVLALIGAGPLEDLVRYAAPTVEPRIIDRVRIDPKFRTTLNGGLGTGRTF